jgi:hypothetical protein
MISSHEPYLFIQKKRPDLVLLALNERNAGTLQLWEQIRHSKHRRTVAFLIRGAIYRPLSCIEDFIGEEQRGEGRNIDLIEKVAALFAA